MLRVVAEGRCEERARILASESSQDLSEDPQRRRMSAVRRGSRPTESCPGRPHHLMWPRLVARSIAIMALALLGQAPAARAMTLVAAPAIHAAVLDGHPQVRPHHRAQHRHVHAQLTRARVSPVSPLPKRPAPHRAERRAAVPHNLRRNRQGPEWRGGLALASSATTGLQTGAPRRPGGIRSVSMVRREGRVISGRGPPCARALESHPPTPPDRPSEFLRSVRSGNVPAASCAPPAFRALPHPPTSQLLCFASVTSERLHVRSHVRRPEGKAACLPTPSLGESL